MYLLDTNIISELRKPKPHGAVLKWFKETDNQDLFLSAVTVGEIQAGILLTHEQNASKAGEIEAWLDKVVATYQILPMDSTVFRTWAKLLHRRSGTLYEDAMIAATASVHKLVIVTRNVADFKVFNIPLFNPFEYE